MARKALVIDFDADEIDVPEVPPPVAPSRGRVVSDIVRRDTRELAMHSSKSQEHYTPVDIIERARRLMGSIDLDPASSFLANTRVQAQTWHGWDGEKITNGLIPEWHGNVFLNPPGGKTEDHQPQLTGVSKSFAAIWWAKLVAEWRCGRVKQAVFVGFTLELLVYVQGITSMHPLQFPCCIPSSRIKFDYPEETRDGRPVLGATEIGEPETITCAHCTGSGHDGSLACAACQGRGYINSNMQGVERAGKILQGSQPTHGNFIVWLPPHETPATVNPSYGDARDLFRKQFGELGVCV
jgi:hypothetical protein